MVLIKDRSETIKKKNNSYRKKHVGAKVEPVANGSRLLLVGGSTLDV